jgi:eukaryotic-like serine/threonine-protein kinase
MLRQVRTWAAAIGTGTKALLGLGARGRRDAAAEVVEVVPPDAEPFGPFHLIQKLGEGGMAEVFAALRRGRPGAGPMVVKRLRAELAQDERAVAHFQAEGLLARTLSHPNIVTMLEHGDVEGRRYLCTEYLPGRDLGCLTRRMVSGKQRPLSASAILYIAGEVASALAYAHSRRGPDGRWLQLVHRDITPENILVARNGGVKLLDFGIAQAGAAERDVITGNIDFMSPEQARARPVDARADLFSLGLVMYFCAARAPLYRRKDIYDRLLQAAEGPGDEELAFIAGLPPPLPHILPGLLAVDPGQRLQTAGELRAKIAEYSAGGREELAATMARVFGPALDEEEQRLACAATPSRRLL